MAGLSALADWLRTHEVTHVAIESTGVYWRPVYTVLEGLMTVLLVNARHVKNVPGRKTDVRDCEWLAQLLECGLLRASFVPPPPIREEKQHYRPSPRAPPPRVPRPAALKAHLRMPDPRWSRRHSRDRHGPTRAVIRLPRV